MRAAAQSLLWSWVLAAESWAGIQDKGSRNFARSHGVPSPNPHWAQVMCWHLLPPPNLSQPVLQAYHGTEGRWGLMLEFHLMQSCFPAVFRAELCSHQGHWAAVWAHTSQFSPCRLIENCCKNCCHLNHHDFDLIVLIGAVEEWNAGVFQQGAHPLLRVLDFSEKLHYLLCCGVVLAWLSSFSVNRGETGLMKSSSLLFCFIW